MKFFRKISLLAIVLLLLCFEVSAGTIEKGFEALKIYNYFAAKKCFEKGLKKDSSAAAYGLATIYYRQDNPFHSLDSAYRYISISEKNYEKIADKKREAWKVFDFDLLNILKLRENISSAFYKLALTKNSIEAYSQFIEEHGWSKERSMAVHKRDSMAFERADFIHTAKAYEQYIATYPASEYHRTAQISLELSQYLEATRTETLVSYLSFMKTFPRNRHVKEAEDRVYELSVHGNRMEDYVRFIETYPTNRNVEEAWRTIYQLFMSDYSEDRISLFQQKFPSYPFQQELLQDMKFAQRNLVPMKAGELFGFMDFDGNIIIEPEYEYAGFYHEGLAVVARNGKYGYIDKGNAWAIAGKYESATDFENGRAIVGKNEMLGVIDRAGNVVMDLSYSDIGTFSEGLIYAKKDELYGYYDNTGYQRLDELYSEAYSFSGGLAKVQLNNKQAYIDIYGSTVVPPAYENIRFFTDSFLVFFYNDRYGIMRKNADIIDSATYDFIGTLVDNRALVTKNGKIGYIDSTGKIVLDLKFDLFPNYLETGQFFGGYAVVCFKGKFGIIDKWGKMTVPATYLRLGHCKPITAFTKGKGWGFVDLNNSVVIPAQFDFAESFEKGFAIVEKAGLLGMINSEGEVSLPIIFTEITRLDDSLVIVSNGQTKGLYHVDGREIVPLEYKQIRLFNKDFLTLTKEDEIQYFYLPEKKLIKAGAKHE